MNLLKKVTFLICLLFTGCVIGCSDSKSRDNGDVDYAPEEELISESSDDIADDDENDLLQDEIDDVLNEQFDFGAEDDETFDSDDFTFDEIAEEVDLDELEDSDEEPTEDSIDEGDEVDEQDNQDPYWCYYENKQLSSNLGEECDLDLAKLGFTSQGSSNSCGSQNKLYEIELLWGDAACMKYNELGRTVYNIGDGVFKHFESVKYTHASKCNYELKFKNDSCSDFRIWIKILDETITCPEAFEIEGLTVNEIYKLEIENYSNLTDQTLIINNPIKNLFIKSIEGENLIYYRNPTARFFPICKPNNYVPLDYVVYNPPTNSEIYGFTFDLEPSCDKVCYKISTLFGMGDRLIRLYPDDTKIKYNDSLLTKIGGSCYKDVDDKKWLIEINDRTLIGGCGLDGLIVDGGCSDLIPLNNQESFIFKLKSGSMTETNFCN